MKTLFLNSIRILLLTVVLSACNSGGYNKNETDTNATGNNNPTDDNKGNHANTPRQEPGTQYPGSANDTGATKDTSSQHKAFQK